MDRSMPALGAPSGLFSASVSQDRDMSMEDCFSASSASRSVFGNQQQQKRRSGDRDRGVRSKKKMSVGSSRNAATRSMSDSEDDLRGSYDLYCGDQDGEEEEEMAFSGGSKNNFDKLVAPKKKTIASYNFFVDLVKRDGSFEWTDSIVASMLPNASEMERKNELLSKFASVTQDDNVVATILVLAYLETFFKSDKNSWVLINRKGIAWLKKKGIADFEGVLSIGAELLKRYQ